jgi:hypothetical protein
MATTSHVGFQALEKHSCPIDVFTFLRCYFQQGYLLVAVGLTILQLHHLEDYTYPLDVLPLHFHDLPSFLS